MKKLISILVTLFTVFPCIYFASCSNDEPGGDFVGLWQESWYDDYVSIKSNGTGFWSETPNPTEANYNSGMAAKIEWSYKNGWFTIIDTEEDECMFKARAILKERDMIVFNEYACDERGNLSTSQPINGRYASKDSYGYYEEVRFVRYK